MSDDILKPCPICDKSYDVEKSFDFCDEHEDYLDSWVITQCQECGCYVISQYADVCMLCLMEDNPRVILPTCARYDTVNNYLVEIGQR